MTSDHAAVFGRLLSALSGVSDALVTGDLEQLLAVEPQLAGALDGVVRLRPATLDGDMRAAIAEAHAALLRCRRLGASLVEFTRISLDPTGEAGYSRAGRAPATDHGGASATAAVGTTVEARV